jgi:uncharacterized membrane protein YphA (DoxX/SURF4 family)
MAGVRVAAAVFFLLFGEYKVAGPGFAHGGFQTFLHDSIANSAVIFYRPILSGLVLPHPVVFGYLVGVVELRIGIALLVGLWVRLACVLGILFLLNLTLAAWREPGHGARGGALFWRSAGSFAVAVAAHQASFSLLRSLLRMRDACGVGTDVGGGSIAVSRGGNKLAEKETHHEEDLYRGRGNCAVFSCHTGNCSNFAARCGACGASARGEERQAAG